jgi:hypothetical protein
MTANGIGTTWHELLTELDRWCEALTADHEIAPIELEAAAADLSQRAYVLMSTALRRERADTQ